jgi:hypothetical protein
VSIFAEPFEQPALDRVENLQLDGYCEQLGLDLLHLTNCAGVGIAQSAMTGVQLQGAPEAHKTSA